MGNAGEARLDVVAMGRDEVTAVMNKVSGELDAMKGKLAAYEKAQRGTTEASKESTNVIGALTTKMASLKESAAPVNKVREAFENLKSNAGFAIGSITGLVTGLVSVLGDLVLSLSDNAQAIEKWTQVSANMEAGLKRSRDLIADVNKLLGETPPTEMEAMLARLDERMANVADEISTGKRAMEAFRDQVERATAFAPALGLATADATAAIAEQQQKLNKLQQDQIALDRTRTALLDRQTQLTREQVALVTWLGGEATKASEKPQSDLRVEGDKPTKPRPPRGGGGRAPRVQTEQEGVDAVLGTGRWAEKEPDQRLANIVDQGLAEPDGVERFLARLKAKLAEFEKLQSDAASKVKITLLDDKEANEEAERINMISAAIGHLGEKVAEVSPNLGAMFAQLASTWAGIGGQWDSIKDKAGALAGGVVGSVDSILAASAQWFKTEKEQTRFLAAKEALLAIPLWFIDPAQAAAKTAASIGLFALAGGGGGGSGSGGGGGSARVAGGNAGGGNASGGVVVNNVHNYQMGFGDRQTMVSAYRQGERTSRGTGANAGVGV